MHSMHKTEEDTVTSDDPVRATFGPPRTPNRKPRMDTMLAEAIDTARSALTDFVDEAEIGDHLGLVAEDERLVTHRFGSKVGGYGGWELFATLARAPRSKVVTVCETGMLPGDKAITAPAWVPWMDRASEEERIRLDAIAAGEDPTKALEEAGYGTPEAEEEPAEQPQLSEDEQAEKNKQARRDAKRRRAKQKAARQKKTKKSGGKNSLTKASKGKN